MKTKYIKVEWPELMEWMSDEHNNQTVFAWNDDATFIFVPEELYYNKVNPMDWEKFRAETAARCLAVIIGPGYGSMPKETAARHAVEYADELIKQLKNENN